MHNSFRLALAQNTVKPWLWICAGALFLMLWQIELKAQFTPALDQTYDFLLHGGIVIDGTGSAPYPADVLISDDSIVFIGEVDTTAIPIRKVMNVKGRFVAPGFIDSHAHGDPFEDDFDNFLSMGVTTIVLGQDGQSIVHRRGPAEFFRHAESQKLTLNQAFLAGHGSLRHKHMADGFSKEGLTQLISELEASLRAGCFGMSTGLEYLPGLLADDSELIPCAKSVGHYDGVIMSHIRNEDDDQIEASLAELIRQGQFTRVHVSHIKSVYGKGANRGHDILRLLENARKQGVDITADVYPYEASYTGIGIVFPTWAKTRSAFENARVNRTEELRKHLQHRIMQRNGPESTLFATGRFAGRTLAEVAEASGQSFVDVLMNIGPLGASGAYFVMNEELQAVFITNPTVAICSDGGPNMRHPRGYGTHAKVLSKYVRDQKSMSLESAVHKMSGLPAAILGLEDRGVLAVGRKADLIVFNLQEVQDHATYTNPFQKATGFEYVFVNGHLAKEFGVTKSREAGRLLRK